MERLFYNGKPHLVLYSGKSVIKAGTELRYNYGDNPAKLWWRRDVSIYPKDKLSLTRDDPNIFILLGLSYLEQQYILKRLRNCLAHLNVLNSEKKFGL